jgi:hypothetical protein
MQLQVDQETVGVGDALHVHLTVQSGQGMPSDPRLGPTPGFVVRSQNESPSQTHIIMNGTRIDQFGLTVDWTLQAKTVGAFRLGPPSVVVDATRYTARPVSVHVVAAGQAPRPAPQPLPSPFSFSPFDPWKGLFPGFDQPEPQPMAQLPLTLDPKLAVDVPRGAHYFLRGAIDKPAVVVGEQVTFTVYEYTDPDAVPIELDGSAEHEPSVGEFIKHSLLRDDQEAQTAGYAAVGGRPWTVRVVRRLALFPLHAGDLEIGAMSESVVRPRSAMGKRTTEAIHVHVTEPPLAGRPPGYALGDVGRFALTATVDPRRVDQGGATGVHLEVSGVGNLPGSLTTPAREGIEWLTPEVHEQLGPAGQDKFGGKRSFDFVVRVARAGEIDLGVVALPYWDPDERRYEVARAPLGGVHARAVTAPGPSGEAPREESLSGLPAPRDALESMSARHPHAADSPLFWLVGVGAWPFLFGLVVAGRSAAGRLRDAWRAHRASPTTELKERVVAAKAACNGNDARSADAAIARALEAATVAHAGVSVRGAVGEEVVERLRCAGVGHEAATRLAELLRECEAARFAPAAADVVAARDRWLRAQGSIRQLEQRVRPAPVRTPDGSGPKLESVRTPGGSGPKRRPELTETRSRAG